MGLQVWNIIFFPMLHELEKPIVSLQMCNIISSPLAWIEKNNLRVQKCATSFSSSLAWIKITAYRLISVQYHFSSSPMWIFLKLLASPQVWNIISFLHLCELEKTSYRLTKCAISFFFFIYVNKKNPLVGPKVLNIFFHLHLCELKTTYGNRNQLGVVWGQDWGGDGRFDLGYYWGIFGVILMNFGQGKK